MSKGGGKLGRSETVTVRMTPQLKHFCGILAMREHRTLSSFIERVLIDEVEKSKGDRFSHYHEGVKVK